jgi:hypothetical protein
MTLTTIRGVPVIALTGTRALECNSAYELAILLRQQDDVGSDTGAVSFREYDTGSQPVPGNGYIAELRDSDRRNLLATGSVAQRGARARIELAMTAATDPETDWAGTTLVVKYPDLSDQTVTVPPIVTVTYTWVATTPAVVNEVRATTSVAESIDNLVRTMNGDLDYGDSVSAYPGSSACNELVSYREGTTLAIEARDGGVWGNGVELTTNVAYTSGATTKLLSGGNGRRGLALTFDAADLPNSLMASGYDVMRRCYLDIMGLDYNSEPTKLVACPAQLHATATGLPSS